MGDSERRGGEGPTRTRRTHENENKVVSRKLAVANVANVRQPEDATLWGRRYISVRRTEVSYQGIAGGIEYVGTIGELGHPRQL